MSAVTVTVLLVAAGWHRGAGLVPGPPAPPLSSWIHLAVPLLVVGVLAGHGPASAPHPDVFFVLAAYHEEVLARGLILEAYRPMMGRRAVFDQALFFALAHLGNLVGTPSDVVASQVVNAFGFGVVYGAVRLRGAPLWQLIAAHAGYDLILARDPTLTLGLARSSVSSLVLTAYGWVLLFARSTDRERDATLDIRRGYRDDGRG